MENGEIEKMDSCKKFTYAMANNLQMYSRVIGYVAPDEKCSVFQFEEVSAQYVAKALTNETEEIFLSMDPANSALVSSMNEFSDFTKAVSKKLKFIKFQK